MRDKIISVMANVFEMEASNFPAEVNQNNIDNWDSLRHLSLIVELEEAFNVSYEPEEIAVMTTLDKIIEVTKQK